ncbi:unnamed protein product [Pieris macdunnoughi]|uniref:Mos1 transposase HTH domain-containing protein n=1 Tax=Pieris macdunnoughi TaxID=345717 RepID=A0A821WF06_9NEOP|nr:unnamed protein product [Pieris macdunnoughi]
MKSFLPLFAVVRELTVLEGRVNNRIYLGASTFSVGLCGIVALVLKCHQAEAFKKCFHKHGPLLVELKNKPRGRLVSTVDNDELKAIVKADPTKSTAELAAYLGASVKTTLKHFRQIGNIKKLDKLVPDQLSDQQRDLRVDACIAYEEDGDCLMDQCQTCTSQLLTE